jgi:hypothetical protein
LFGRRKIHQRHDGRHAAAAERISRHGAVPVFHRFRLQDALVRLSAAGGPDLARDHRSLGGPDFARRVRLRLGFGQRRVSLGVALQLDLGGLRFGGP